MGTDLVPFFSSDNGEEADVAGMLRAWDRAELASRTLKAGILLVAAGAIVLAVVSAGNPLVLFSKARASLIGTSADDAGQPAPIVQSTAEGQVSPPAAPDATDEPKGDDTAFVREAADQSQTEIRQQPAEDVLKQLQAWAAEKDAQEKAAPVQSVEPVEAAAPVQPAEPRTGCTGNANTGCASARTAGPARATAPAHPSCAKCAGRDPACAKCPSEGRARKKHRSRYSAHRSDQGKPTAA